MFGIFLLIISNFFPLLSQIEDELILRAPNNSVTLTFDDGPHPVYTAEILDILREKNVKAAFFIVGAHIKRDEKAIMREVREGHTVGSHSYSHQNFSKLTKTEIAKEVLLTHIELFGLTGKYPDYFRFPYGVDDIRIRDFYSGRIIGWNIDAYDWRGGNPKKLAEKIIMQARTGSIILLHDIKGDTVKALPYIIEGIRAKNLEFAPLPSFMSSIAGAKDKNIQFFSRLNTGVLHDHTKSKKPQPKSTEDILPPIVITKVSQW